MYRVLKWILVLEEYGLEIEYIQCKLNIVAYALLQLPNNGNQSATKKFNYIKETVYETNDKEELSEGTFPINFKIMF